MHILVTGAAGFIGFYTCKKLLEEGHTVIGLDSLNDYYDVTLKYDRLQQLSIKRDTIAVGKKVTSLDSSFTFIQESLENRSAMERLFADEKFDTVINLAAQAGVRYSIENPHAYIESNIVGFLHILEGCRHTKVKHLIYASSSSVYGDTSPVPFSVLQQVDEPVSLYAATKKANELMAHSYSKLYSIPTTGLRFFTVYGPWGRPDMAPMLFASALKSGKSIKLFNNGDMQRDFTYIDDIIAGTVGLIGKAPSTEIPYEVFNIGNGDPVQLLDFVEELESAFGKKAEKELCPMQPGDVHRTYADVTALNKKIGYAATTPISKGVPAFVEWYKTYYGC